MHHHATKFENCNEWLLNWPSKFLTLNAPIAMKVVCFFSSAEMFKKPLWQTVWTQIRLLLCSGSTLFASILISSVMLGNYLQQTTSADDIFRCIFFCIFSWRLKGWKLLSAWRTSKIIKHFKTLSFLWKFERKKPTDFHKFPISRNSKKLY